MGDLWKEPVSAFSVSTDAKGLRSFCWTHFGALLFHKEGKRRVVDESHYYCLLCFKRAHEKAEEDNLSKRSFGSFSIQKFGRNVSTGNLNRHLRDAHNLQDVISKGFKQKQTTLDNLTRANRKPDMETRSTKDRRWLLARDLTLWFCRALLPFDLTENEGTTDFMKKYKVIGETECMPVRTTISRDALADIYVLMQDHIKGLLARSPRFGALTFDLWMDSHRRRSYIDFIYHHIADDLTALHKYTLAVGFVQGKKTGTKICDEISNVLEKYGLSKKKIAAVADAGANVKLTVQLAVQLAEMESHLCLGHGLHNLVVVDGLQTSGLVKALLKKVKSTVRAVRYRAAELEEEAVKEQRTKILAMIDANEVLDAEENDPIPTDDDEEAEDDIEQDTSSKTEGPVTLKPPKTVKTDSATRWFSTLDMCESVDDENRGPINTILQKIGQQDLTLSATEWKLLRGLVGFLKLFRGAVTLLSAEKNCTLNIALLMRSEIESCLKEDADDPPTIAEIKMNMRRKLNHRFPLTDLVVTAALLDPRFHSLNEVEAYLEKKNLTKGDFLLSQMSKRLRESDIHLERTIWASTPTSVNGGAAGAGAASLAELARKHSSNLCQETRAKELEIQAYLATSSVSSIPDGDVLKFWCDRQAQFP